MVFTQSNNEFRAQKGPFVVLSGLALVLTGPVFLITFTNLGVFLGLISGSRANVQGMIVLAAFSMFLLAIHERLLRSSTYTFSAQSRTFQIRSRMWIFKLEQRMFHYHEIKGLHVISYGDPDREGPFLQISVMFNDKNPIVIDPKCPYTTSRERKDADTFLEGSGLGITREDQESETKINRHLREKREQQQSR